MDITVYISCVHDWYIQRCLKTIKKLRFFEDININLDWFRTSPSVDFSKSDRIGNIQTHKEYHGSRLYTLLEQSKTDRIMMFDSDFFCCDDSFWNNAWLMSSKFSIVSIGRKWRWGMTLPSTPFLILKKDLLDLLPNKSLWNHFGRVFPEIPDPLFDNMQYLFLLAMKRNLCGYIDVWYPLEKKKYKFYHMWGSLQTKQQDFERYQKTGIKLYLARWVSKEILFSIVNGLTLNKQFYNTLDIIMNLYPHHAALDIIDLFKSADCCFILEERDRFRSVKNSFFNRYQKYQKYLKGA